MIVRYENKGIGFDRYLQQEVKATKIGKHRYLPWGYILIHGKYEGTGAEAKHFVHVLNALNMVLDYYPESNEQITEWVLAGFKSFVTLQQNLFRKMFQECLELNQAAETSKFTAPLAVA